MVRQSRETKSLGLQIDEHLAWARHVENISRKIASAIGALTGSYRHCPKNLYSIDSTIF